MNASDKERIASFGFVTETSVSEENISNYENAAGADSTLDVEPI